MIHAGFVGMGKRKRRFDNWNQGYILEWIGVLKRD